jgi:hypothetical protein
MKSIYTSILAIFLTFTSYSQSNIYVGDIVNNIKIGPLTGNKNLAFGTKKVKEFVATGKSSEISTSTMIIDEGGGFNQASARSALKKTIINLIEKLL